MNEIPYDPPDSRPGYYYVTVRRDGLGGTEYRRLRGPWPTHAEALAAVPVARDEAYERDARAWWYAYGTCRATEDLGPGILDREPVAKYQYEVAA